MNFTRAAQTCILVKNADQPHVTKAFESSKHALLTPDGLQLEGGLAMRSKGTLARGAKPMIELRADVTDGSECISIPLTLHAAVFIILRPWFHLFLRFHSNVSSICSSHIRLFACSS